MKKLLPILAFLFIASPAFAAGQAILTWNANTELDLAGYKVYYGTASGKYGTPIDVGKVTTKTITPLADGTYFFAVTAYDTSGNESGFSNEVSKAIDTTAPAPPSGLSVLVAKILSWLKGVFGNSLTAG